MLKFAKILVFCSFALAGVHAFAQDAAQPQTENPSADAAKPQAEAAPADAAKPQAEAAPADAAKPQADAAPADAAAAPSNAANANQDSKTAEAKPVEEAKPDTEILTESLLDKQLREVSTNLDTLKEDTFTTKSRLLLLREEVLQRSVSGSRLQLRHMNDMGGQYELVQVYYAIDHTPVYSKQDTSGDLNKLNDEVLYDRILAPGAHQLSVLYVYKGKPWGVFRYMKDYTFRVQSGYDFNVEEGKAAELIVTASEQGNFFTAYEERPHVTFNYQQYDLISGNAADSEQPTGN